MRDFRRIKSKNMAKLWKTYGSTAKSEYIPHKSNKKTIEHIIGKW